jgi:hypothetical protein
VKTSSRRWRQGDESKKSGQREIKMPPGHLLLLPRRHCCLTPVREGLTLYRANPHQRRATWATSHVPQTPPPFPEGNAV